MFSKHIHRLELQVFLNFCAAHLPVKRHIYRDEIPDLLFRTQNKKYFWKS